MLGSAVHAAPSLPSLLLSASSSSIDWKPSVFWQRPAWKPAWSWTGFYYPPGETSWANREDQRHFREKNEQLLGFFLIAANFQESAEYRASWVFNKLQLAKLTSSCYDLLNCANCVCFIMLPDCLSNLMLRWFAREIRQLGQDCQFFKRLADNLEL